MNKFRQSAIVLISIFVGTFVTTGLVPMISNAQPFQSAELDVDFTGNYTLVWTDKGSGAGANVSFWRPEPATGWFRVGHHMNRGYGNPTEPTIVVRERVSGALARPVDYFLIWDDTGSGATQDGSVWRPACPGGYRAMGDLTSPSHTKPALDEVVCVRETALATTFSGNEIWNDTGSGAVRDFAAWGINTPTPNASFTFVSRGLFFGAASHNRPLASSIGGLWAIKLPKPSGGGVTPVNSFGGSADQQFWEVIKNSNRAQDFQDYLSAFPNGQFAPLARFRMGQLPTTNPGSGGGFGTVRQDPDQQFWDSVKNSQRASDFQGYLNSFPNGQFAALARFKMGQLSPVNPIQPIPTGGIGVDEQFWNSVKNSNSPGDFQSYLSSFPNGQFAALARLKMSQLSPVSPTGVLSIDEQFWNSVKNSNNSRDFQSYLDNFPNGQFAALARLNRDRFVGGGSPGTPPVNQGTSRNAAFLNQWASDTRSKLPRSTGNIQLFDAVSHCQSGCQQTDNTDSIVIRTRTPGLSKQSVSIGQIEQTLKPALISEYCSSPGRANNVSLGVEVDDTFNQRVGNFFLNPSDCSGNSGNNIGSTSSANPSVTGFQQVIAAAQPGSIAELARARSFFVVSTDFSVKSKIAASLIKELPQLRAATSEQSADFLIGFELTDRKTGLVTANDSANPNLRGEMIVFSLIPASPGRPESIRILFRVTKERGFGVFSATPDENAAKEFAKQLAKVII